MKGFQLIYTGEDHRHGDSLQKHTDSGSGIDMN